MKSDYDLFDAITSEFTQLVTAASMGILGPRTTEALNKQLFGTMGLDSSGILQKMYDFFNTVEKPLTPVEFFTFMMELSDEEGDEFEGFAVSLAGKWTP